MVRGILQFTPRIAFRYVLHRCESLDIRCRESFGISVATSAARRPPEGAGARVHVYVFLGAYGAGKIQVRSSRRPAAAREGRRRGGRAQTPEGRASGGEGRGSRRRPARVPPPLRESGGSTVRGCAAAAGRDNDPSAGSPTETLLRLLLPLNDKVQWTSRDVAGGGPPASPRSEHFTGPFNR